MKAADALFEILSDIAARGERCPTGGDLDRLLRLRCGRLPRPSSAVLTDLALDGKLLVKVHGRNWRTVEILEGPHRGKSTMPSPMAVYMIADRAGYHRVDSEAFRA